MPAAATADGRDPIAVHHGFAFGYFVVLAAAVRFFQNFNGDQFNVLSQANPY